MTSMITTIG